MSARLKQWLACAVLTASALSFRADAGHRMGNGGDYIRATFMQMGGAVVDYLKTTPEGRALVQDNRLDTDALADTLSIDVVKVSDVPLLDNGNSQVDAIGEPDSITLSHDAWFEHFERDRDVYFLVLHEMLRAKGIDDDNYVISGSLRPFPETHRIVTSIGADTPLLPGDDVGAYVDLDSLAVTGAGCPSGFGAMVDFDPTRNVVGLRLTDFAVFDAPGLSIIEGRKACTISLGMRALPSGKRLVATQIDASAEVDLQKRGSFTISSNAWFSGSAGDGARSKTVSANGRPVAGRLLQRIAGATVLASACGSAGRPLNLSVSGRVSRAGSANAVHGRVLGAAIYLRLDDCED
jgi:hypothetical protein